jgi:hypothetical protein
MVIVVMVGAIACGGERLGVLQVNIRLETPSGISRACVDYGADQVELTFFADSEDLVPHDVVTADCEATAAGWAMVGLRVTAQTYHRVALRFVSSTGNTVGVCTPAGRMDAVLEQTDVKVESGVLGKLDFLLVGDTLPCAE